jgi:hypothetical protein
MKALVAGWFSFEDMGATAGDLMVRDLAARWLADGDVPFDVALAAPFEGGVDWRAANPADYTHVVFVCGPFGNGWPVTGLLARFAGCKLLGLNLSMLESLEAWNPFELLIERDSSRTSRPDMAFLSNPRRVPIAGVVLIHPQPEYGQRDLHQPANDAIRRLIASRELAAVEIDTRLDVNATGLRTPAEIESLVARMDVVLTTRLHGVVLSLKNGVPVVAIDPVAGGAKISRQTQAVGWPMILAADRLHDGELAAALDYCLTPEARAEARQCCIRASRQLSDVRDTFLGGLGLPREVS